MSSTKKGSRRNDAKEQKEKDKIMLSTKDLIFKKRPTKKLVD